MKNIKWWPAVAGAVVSVALVSALAGCGGSGSSGSGSIRLVNATISHPSLDLLVTSNAAKVASGVGFYGVSDYGSISTSATPLQIDDAGSVASIVGATPTIGSGSHYALVAYETNGAVKAGLLQEDLTTPASGFANLRVFNAAVDAGKLDIYVYLKTNGLTAGTTPSFVFNTVATYAQAVSASQFTPNAEYSVTVTGQGDKTDVRLTIDSITFSDQEIATLILTPTPGGVQVNGALLIQQGAITGEPNTTARVRLVTSITGLADASNGGVSASAVVGTTQTSIGSGFVSGVVGVYTTVDASGALTASVNGSSIGGINPATLTAGTDSTLLVYGDASLPQVAVIADDNHLPSVGTSAKMRLVNGVASQPQVTFAADAGVVASNVVPGTGSTYTLVPSGTTLEFDITSPSVSAPLDTLLNQNVLGNAVYTMFVLYKPPVSEGDNTTPALLRRDRTGS